MLGNVTVDYWITSQKVLSDIHFLSRIRTFPRDKVSNKTMRLIRANYLSKPEFDAENMKQVSAAAEGLCFWVKAIDIYNKIAKVVDPKKEKLKKSELMVKQHMKQLEQRRKALQEVTERLQKLSDQFSHMSQRKQDLQNQIQNCELKMTRAEKLLETLENERGRWDSNLKVLKIEYEVFKRYCLIVAIYVELLNNVDYDKRKEIITKILTKFHFPPNFSLKSILKHTSVLLSDRNERISEPYMILELTRKIPLIIDPQGESTKMLSQIFPETMSTIDIHSPSLPTIIVSAIGNGSTLLIDNLRKPFPLYLIQLIHPLFIKDGKETFLQINNKLFDFNPKFCLILRTEKQPKEFSEILLQKFCIINVSVGENVIKNKLMEIFLKVNAFPLTSKRDQLMAEKTALLRQSDAAEDGTLEALAKSKDLDDDKTIDLLGEVREMSKSLNAKIKELNEVEDQLEIVKQTFIKVGEFGTNLVKASVNISKISPVYARTLRYYLEVFRKAVSVESTQLNESEIPAINQNVLAAFRRKISRSLFAEHRKIFEFLIKSNEK
uniref:Uncharacterized protein n=1 Tax=Panagrolaimus sp. PS1159 TaxID=55785 RepID=A0AC35FFV6_9BILA